ncbi:type II toxin-antitoxin system PemK/MazF family toxin [Planctellipticum variicoloris]|uniref:type II toxin-antitoxin system PemK/MazF family toxin n=1 Tax=Planctellipticum variicoloris TaxID=3064265 RepID=UPI0030134B7F|nr:type II toxin-antitoxin system PemK/MazF family toxin [Planctomycetaceae bacterium SH412]
MSTSLNRGDLVVVDFRPVNPRAGVRPALVVQNDRDNRRLTNTVVAQISSNVRRAGEDTQLLIDQRHSDWTASGLRHPSAVICSNIYTISQDDVARVIGSLSDTTMQQVNERLRIVLGLSSDGNIPCQT